MQRNFGSASALLSVTALIVCLVAVGQTEKVSWDVLPPIVEGNLAVFPVVTASSPDTSQFLTLDEGIRSNQVVVTESGSVGLVRPRTQNRGLDWPERPIPVPLPFPAPPSGGARVMNWYSLTTPIAR